VFTVPGKAERERIRGDEEQAEQARRREKQKASQLKREKQMNFLGERKRFADENRLRRIAAEQFERESVASKLSEVVRCPFCSEEVLAGAKKCKHCGEFLANQEEMVAPALINSRTYTRPRSRFRKTLAVLGILLFVSLVIRAVLGPDHDQSRQTPFSEDGTNSSNKKNADLLIAGIAVLGGDKAIETVSVSEYSATITVSNAWHVVPYQIRLQAAQNIWKLWATISAPVREVEAKISIVDLNGNEVGGSRVWGGSLIWVQEN
jgi:hypothetical protein